MDFFDVLALLGGLAMFLFGMHLMSDGLAKLSGSKMEKILEINIEPGNYNVECESIKHIKLSKTV